MAYEHSYVAMELPSAAILALGRLSSKLGSDPSVWRYGRCYLARRRLFCTDERARLRYAQMLPHGL